MAELTATRRIAPGPVPRAGGPARSWPTAAQLLPGMGLVVLAVILLLGGPTPSPEGLPDAGPVTGWLLPVARGAMDLAAVATLGSLVAAVFLVPAPGDRISGTAHRALTLAGRFAWVWAAAATALVVLTTSDVVGVRLRDVLGSPALLRFGWQLPEGRALLAMTFAALVVAMNAHTMRRRTGAAVLLVGATLGMVPLLLSGHSAATADHYLATQGLLVHVLGATFWVGGLLALVLVVRQDRDALRVALPRFSALALVCFAAVAGSGLLTAWTRLGLSPDSWWSTYGAIVGGKALALLVLGGFGLLHRRRTIASVLSGRPGAFGRLAGVETLVMAAAVGLAVVLSRTAPPVGVGLDPGRAHGGRFSTVDRDIDAFGVPQLFTQWRPDATVVTAVAVLAVGYLLAVRHLRRNGGTWPAVRIGWAMAGLAVMLFVLCAGPGAYANAMLSMHTAQLLTMLVVAPVLLTMAAPVELVRTVAGVPDGAPPSATARTLADPVNGVTLMTLLVLGVFATPVLDLSLSNGAVHLLVNVAALGVGMVTFGAVLGADWLPVTRSSDDRAVLLLIPVAVLVLLAFFLWRAETGYGQQWFDDLSLWWSDTAADRDQAALVALAFTLPLLAVAVRLARRRVPGSTEPETETASV